MEESALAAQQAADNPSRTNAPYAKFEIWRYGLNNPGTTTLEVPKNSRILHVGLKGNDLNVWIQVDPKSPKKKMCFDAIITGVDIPPPAVEISRDSCS